MSTEFSLTILGIQQETEQTYVKITPGKGHNRCKGPEQACIGLIGGTGWLDQSAGRGVGDER